MKTLYILRHAEAEPARGDDFERDLTAQGFEKATALGRLMREKNYIPQFAACSSALRTKRTLEGILESIKIPAPVYDRKIYHATAEDLLTIIRGFDNAHQSALVVGHNPTIHEIAAALAKDGPSELMERLASAYTPGTLSVFEISEGKWREAGEGKSKLVDLISI